MTDFVVSVPMPFTGESIVDGILVSWMIEPGDVVTKGQPVAELETEKSVWEFESPCSGTIVGLKAEAGDVVDVNAPLFDIRTSDADVRHLLEIEESAKVEKVASSVAQGSHQVSPRAKKLLREAGIDESDWPKVAELNSEGRIGPDEVTQFAEGRLTKPKISGNGSSGTISCNIAGIGTYTPKSVVGNDHFVEHFDDIDESYIEKVTGIRERRWVNEESTSDMAISAAREALSRSKIDASKIDMIILATTTADMPLPASACVVAEAIGCDGVPAFDIQAACSGWLYALSIGRQFLRGGTCSNVLVVAAETMSVFTDPTDRATGFLFGDGAGAAILSSETQGHELSDVVMGTDTDGYDIIYRKAGGALMPPHAMESPRDEYWVMDGGRMFRSAVKGFSDVILRVVEREGISIDQVKWFVPHQANQRILKTVAHRLKADPSKFFSNIRLLGNTSAASIPLAMEDLQAQQTIAKGDILLLCAVGAGLTSSGCLIRW